MNFYMLYFYTTPLQCTLYLSFMSKDARKMTLLTKDRLTCLCRYINDVYRNLKRQYMIPRGMPFRYMGLKEPTTSFTV